MLRWIILSCFLASFAFGISLKSLFTYTFDANKVYNLQESKDLYFEKKCHTCHGEQGEKTISGSKKLKDMSPEDIKAALVGYTLDSSASLGASQMAYYAKNLSHDEMDSIIAHIKGVNFAVDLQIQDLIEEEPKQKTKHGTFIK